MPNSAFSPSVFTTGGTTGQGEINIVTNPSAVTDASTGWTSSSVTLSRLASGSPLDPTVPTGFQAVSTTTTTSFISTVALSVPTSLRNRKLKVQFNQALTDSSMWKIDVFKSNNTTRYTLSTDSSSVTVLPALTGTFTTTFDMDTDTAIYVRFTRYAGAGTSTLNFTNLIVGPGIQPQGAAVQNSLTYTLTIGGTTTAPTPGTNTSVASYVRVGDMMKLNYSFRQTALGSAAGSGTYLFPLPTGLTIDSTRIGSFAIEGNSILGAAEINNGTTTLIGVVLPYNSTNLIIQVGNDTTAPTYVSSTFYQVNTNTNLRYSFEAMLPIAEWSGSGTVQLAQNDVEWAANDGTNNVYGPSGTAIPTTSTGAITRTITFQTPIQSTDIITVEYTPSVGGQWLSNVTSERGGAGTNWSTYSSASEVGWGEVRQVSSTQVTVVWRRYKLSTTNWGGSADGYWRVRKSSAGAAVGFGIVVPGTSAGLVSASGVPGNTTGNAIASGYVGEWVFATPGSAVTFGATGVVTNITSLTLTAGTWLVYGNTVVNPGAATMTASYGGVSTSSTTFDSVTYIAGGQHTSAANVYYASLPRVIRTTGTTIYLNGSASYSGTAGTFATTSSIQAIRIA